jgi:hypothetical protein
MTTTPDSAADIFQYRDLLFAVAYRMLGTVADAEDAVQDTWIRWSSAPRGDVAEPKAYLVRIVTNTALGPTRPRPAQPVPRHPRAGPGRGSPAPGTPRVPSASPGGPDAPVQPAGPGAMRQILLVRMLYNREPWRAF